MSAAAARAADLRRGSEDRRVSPLELFYDLVFVFAITQVSHELLAHLTWEGAAQTALVLLVIWWSWNFTTWATNELNPEASRVRLLVVAIMLITLVMAVAIPDAFGERALLFAGSYVAIQLLRTGFLAFAAAGPGTQERSRASAILVWFAAAGVFWIAGALAGHELRTVLWLVALAIDYGGPLATFALPGRPMSQDMWEVEPEHMAERFQLFIIIALGESIVITGATTSELELDLARVLALAVAFLGTAALWWLYFTALAERVGGMLASSAERRVLVARDLFTYLHVVLVAGIVVSAVGDELVIAHPDEVLPTEELLALVAGPVIYLLAQALMRLRATGDVAITRVGGIAGCVAVGLLGTQVSALVTAALLVAVLVAVGLASARRQSDEVSEAR